MTPAQIAVDADMASTRFRVGLLRKQWRLISYDFPLLVMAVSSVEPDGTPGEYSFRFELTGYPAVAPAVQTWDCATNALLPAERRPSGSPRVREAFKSWGPDTVYRPWDRNAGAHGNWTQNYPELAWNSQRDLTFILEDLHGLLTSNAVAGRVRSAA